MRYTFEKQDIENLLNPNCFYVGATFTEDVKQHKEYKDQLGRFIDDGIWENGWGSEVYLFKTRSDSIKKGDVLIVKRLLGKASPDMRVLAMGVVVGQDYNPNKVRVEWTMPRLEEIVPLNGAVGTITKGKKIQDLDLKLRDLVDKCRCRFLRWNLDIQHRNY